MINNKVILITGGTGSFGKKFVDKISKKYKPKKIIIYSRDEQKQFQLQQKWKENKFSNIRYIIPVQGTETATQGLFNQIKLLEIPEIINIQYNRFYIVFLTIFINAVLIPCNFNSENFMNIINTTCLNN